MGAASGCHQVRYQLEARDEHRRGVLGICGHPRGVSEFACSHPPHSGPPRPQVLRAKVRVLARLFREANQAIVYTGAGISVAAGPLTLTPNANPASTCNAYTNTGIDDYATKNTGTSGTASVTEVHPLTQLTPDHMASGQQAETRGRNPPEVPARPAHADTPCPQGLHALMFPTLTHWCTT